MPAILYLDRPNRPRAYLRQRADTGRCVVCGSLTDALGVTCKETSCIRAWVLGHE